MPRTTADAMQTDFVFVDCDVTVAEAEEFFNQSGLTGLPVLNPDRTVFGILTPQNLLDFHRRALNKNPRAVHAWEICDARPLLVNQKMPLKAITRTLLGTPSRHVLVIDTDQHLVGVISADMLLQQYVSDKTTDTGERRKSRASRLAGTRQ